MLLKEFLLPLEMTQRDLARAICVPYQRVNEIVRGRRGISPSTALRLSKFFGVSPGFWTNLQLRWDLYHAQLSEAEQLEAIRPHEPLKAVNAAYLSEGEAGYWREKALNKGL